MEEEWYLTLSNISLCWEAGEEDDVDSPEEIGVFLKRELKNIGVDLKLSTPKDEYKNSNPQVINVGREFPVALLKSLFIWETGKKLSVYAAEGFGAEPEFIVGNHYAAFTNNSRMNYYVPSIKRGFETIQDILNAVAGDLSDCRILEMQYIDLHNLPESVESSEILNPYSILNDKVPEKRFPALIAERRKKKNAYMHKLLKKISQVSFDRTIVCSDTDGKAYLINASKIIQIIPDPNREDNENLKTKIVLESDKSIVVNLEELATEFTGLSSPDSLSLPTSLIEWKEKSFRIEQPREDKSYSDVWTKYEEYFIGWKMNHVWPIIIEPKFDDAKCFEDGIAWVKYEGKWGSIDREGKWVIMPQFDTIQDIVDGVAWVEYEGKWGRIDREGKWVEEPRYDYYNGNYFVNSYNNHRDDDKFADLFAFYDDVVDDDYEVGIALAKDGIALTKGHDSWNCDRWGCINSEGRWLIRPIFKKLSEFKNGIALVEVKGKFGYIVINSPNMKD